MVSIRCCEMSVLSGVYLIASHLPYLDRNSITASPVPYRADLVSAFSNSAELEPIPILVVE